MEKKLQTLATIFRQLEKTAVAFSGGTDSTLLLAAAVKFLGVEHVLAVTAVSATFTGDECCDATNFAAQFGVEHVLIETHEFADKNFTANGADRCYHCKKIRFTELIEFAGARGFAWVVEGSNVDDDLDYRPGARAVAELSAVCSPLKEAGFTKAEIRELSRRWNLPTAEKPAAACLASRIEYGLELTPARLKQIEDAEKFIRRFDTGQLRVRHHGNRARIEVKHPVALAPVENEIRKKLTALGFDAVEIDPSGYRMGNMNEKLNH
ncbi:MAG: ATP-dependent sacrificial sulfur transferase LarE [Kiritimatiellales bacterium]